MGAAIRKCCEKASAENSGVVQIRYLLAVMCFYCLVAMSAVRVNMSINIVSMVNWTSINFGDSYTANKCKYNYSNVRSSRENGPFEWSSVIQGHILACYFYGLAVTPFAGWYLAKKINEKCILLLGTFIATLMNFLIPVAADSNGYIVMVLQVLKGSAHGIIVPAFSFIEAKWVPPTDRPGFVAVVASGMPIGGFFTVVICAIVCYSSQLGWTYGFYIPGIVAAIWCFLWALLMFDSPLTFPYKTKREREGIRRLRIEKSPIPEIPIPVRSILSTLAVWAFIIAGFACYWVLYLYVTVVPLFLGIVLRFDLQMNGLLSAIPRLAEGFILVSSILVSDRLVKKKIKSSTTIRKIGVGIGLFGVALCMLGLTFTECKRIVNVLLLILGMGLSGFSFFAIAMVPVDMSPRFSGTLNGILHTLGALSGAIIPTLIGYLTKDSHTVQEWHYLFYVTAGLCTLAAIIFLCLGSGEIQPWNNPPLIPEFVSSAEEPEKMVEKTEPSPPPVSTRGKLNEDQWRYERPWRTPSFPELPPKPEPPISLGK